MKETIFRYARSIRVRIISAFLAFLIFALGYVGYFEGFEHGMTADALEITSVTKTGNYINKDFVSSTSHDGHSAVEASSSAPDSSHTLSYRYTGAVKTSKVSLYDYKTDTEIGATPTISNEYTNYGSEPFKQFNDAISNAAADTITTTTNNVSPSADNVTIVLKSGFVDNAHVYLWNGDNKNSAWPGDAMEYDSANSQYKITYSMTKDDCNNYLSFTPTALIFNNGIETGGTQTSDVNITLKKGYTYIFDHEVLMTSDDDSNKNKIGLIFDGYQSQNTPNNWENVKIFLWNTSQQGTGYPGETMEKLTIDNKYYYRTYFDYFLPTNYILSRYSNTASGNRQKLTGDASFQNYNFEKGKTYIFKNQNDNATILSSFNTVQNAESISYEKSTTEITHQYYKYPLYFGCFYRENQNATTYTEAMKPKGQTFGNNVLTAGGPYANFYWQANLGMKSTGDGTGDNSVDVRGHAAVQDLVDSTLGNGGKLQQNGVELPYFSSTFASSNPTLMTVYNKSNKGIDFPFYEILADVNDVRKVGSVGNNTDTARFYQFCSDDVNLKFDTSSQQFLEETNTRIRSNNTDGNVHRTGYFPFDNVNSDGASNNLGFGTRFELKFKLNKDGTVDSLDKDGNKSTNPTKIHTMFEFLGDDDLWVFIDGNLVLDLGGTHDKTSGLIDFHDGIAYANKAMSITATGNDPDNLGAAVGIQTKNVKDILSQNGSYDSNTGYDPNYTHTMTIFYLERGMMDSNLMVRFNYKPESNFSKMKIREVTNFSGVNEGLVDLTKKAADNDVFSYHVENLDTASDTPQYTGILYPTYDTFIRNYVNDQINPTVDSTMNDQLTGKELKYEENSATDPDAVFLKIDNWGSESDIYAAWVWTGSEAGKLYLGTKVNNTNNIFKFRGFPDDVDKIKFLKLKSIYAPYFGGNVGWPEGKISDQSGDLEIKKGCLYRYKQSQSSIQLDSNETPPPLYQYKKLKYEAENDSIFKPQSGTSTPVSNTNYLWVDEFAKQSGADIDDITSGFTGRTDKNGNLCLMYGTAGTESSAEFENQFDRDSTMKVTQSSTLYSPTRSGTVTFSQSSRTVSRYYTTTVTAYDRVGAKLTNHNNNSTGSGAGGSGGTGSDYQLNYETTASGMVTDYKFNNSPNIRSDDTLTVMMTEEFENTVKVGAISVTKALKYGETGPVQNHTFQISLTNIMEQEGVNVTDYSNISVTGATSDKLTDDGKFTIHGTGTATITGIPAYTTYTVTEVTPGSYFEQDAIDKGTGKVQEGTGENNATPDGANKVTVTNKRKVGSLTLSKDLAGENNAAVNNDSDDTNDIDKDKSFTFTVTLKEPEGVTFLNNYMTSEITTSTPNDGAARKTYTLTKTVSKETSVTISGIPFGTEYTVTEAADGTNRPDVTYTNKTGTIESEATVTNKTTNTYRKVVLTKKDSKDNHVLQNAKFVLLRMKETYSVDDLQTALASVTAENFSTYYTSTLLTYCDGYSSIKDTNASGQIEILSSEITGGLVANRDYFFLELTAPDKYIKSNDVSANKFTISSLNDNTTTYTYTPEYTNVRQTGDLVLQKNLTNGTPDTENGTKFTYTVTLTKPSDVTDLKQFITRAYLEDQGATVTTYDTGSIVFTIPVSHNVSKMISGLPYGTTYSVTEANPATDTNWVKTAECNVTNNVGIASDSTTVSFTNAKTGSLTISKTVTKDGSADYPNPIPDFTFNVLLSNLPGSLSFEKYGIKLGETLQTANSFTVTISGLTSSSTTGTATISGIPYGTTYTVTEQSTGTYWEQTTPVNGGGCTGSIGATPSTASFTNTYTPPPPTYKSITLTKTDLNGNPLSGVTFKLLKLNNEVDIANDEVKTAFTTGNWSTYATQVGIDKVTDANGQVTFTEDGSTITFENGGRYFFYEVSVPSGSNIIIDNSLTAEKIITIDENESYNKTYKNRKTLSSVEVTVKKTDENGTGLKDAEFELWYKDSTVHPTYTFNDPLTAPLKKTALKVSGTGITVPLAVEPESYTTYDYTYTYDAPSTPSATETEWILPRTDNDYIYFRDFESGTAEHDPGLSKHAWLDTSFETNTYSQEQEIKYDHKYWFAAQFRKSDNSGFVEYAVWERFVDKYENYDTIVWKIQPPDGYSKVRFCLYDGGNCIRTTEEFDYQLGKIYQKTSWGGIYSNGNYYNVPVNKNTPDSWSTYYSTTSNSFDQRLTGADSTMYQAERYEPTEQKIIFHCNSQQVWHNIHIEFFKDAEGNQPVGQQFPGYMMEPYAYAGSDYRLSNGYLTYELTIPSDARYFRINNGIDNSTTNGSFDANSSTQSPYAYRTNIQEISTSGNKNNDNYYILGTDINTRYNCLNGTAPKDAELTKNVNAITSLSHEDTSTTYSSNEVESDCDYIYFAKKKTGISWNDHIYAYFYGGGNLREDNWQRACYSIWPGVAPVGTQFNDGSGHDSTIYDYTPSANPESTFTIKKGGTEYTVYKFRMPEGDRKNYSKVIFNDGLKQKSGTKETSPITYNAGYIYFEDGGSMKHFDNYSTTQYSKRPGNDDYIYIKTSDTAWDDMHITFYDSNGSQIHQGGKGYVMKYAGKDSGYTYYRIPIPTDAAKFKLNNGMDKSTSLETDFGDILRKSTHTSEDNTKSDYTEDKIVYTLDNTNKLTMEPLFTESGTSTTHTSGVQDSNIDYTHTRGDKLNIRNTAGWNIGIGGGQVKFYKENGDLVTATTTPTKGNGTYILIKTVDDGGSPAKEWYTIEIPDGAVSFTLTYNGGANTTARNPIYPKSATGEGIDGNYTTGGMYYETTTGGALSLMTTTLSPVKTETDITAAKRSDTLYLLCTSETAWKDMTVTFLNSSGTAITGATGVKASYIGKQGSDYWWSISIPTGAASFTVTKDSNTTDPAEIYPLSKKLSRYKKDYTLGDMQYRLPNPADSSKPGLLYPIFTQDDEYTLEVGGKTITTASGTALIDESAITTYAGASTVTTPSTSDSEPTSPYPVLYSTSTDSLTYSWTEGAGESTYIRLTKPSWMTSPKVSFYTGSSWTEYYTMTQENGDRYICSQAIPNNATKIKFMGTKDSTDVTTSEKTLPSDISTKNYLYTITTDTGCSYINWLTVYASSMDHMIIHLWGDGDSGTFGSVSMQSGAPTGLSIPSGNTAFKYEIPSDKDYTDAIIFNDNGNDYWCIHISGIQNGGRGQVYYRGSQNGHYEGENWIPEQDSHDNKTSTVYSAGYDSTRSYSSSDDTYTIADPSVYSTITATTTYTATYQPEDRYGFITNRSDYSTTISDRNNCIYISTTISDPYITFYSDTEGTTKIGGNDMATAGISLKKATLDGTNIATNTGTTNLYRIRLPRNAKSFKLANGASGELGTAVPLKETIYVKTDRTITTSSDTSGIAMTNYHHAGTTFTATSTDSVIVTTLRSGFTISRDTEISKTSPKSDIDYVFFTDTSNTIKGTDGAVYAYFYGGTDGEFAHWPGIQAESSYTDNAGNTVYRFRMPKDTNGTYTKVIFNNGSASGRKITQADNVYGGYNYTLDTSASTVQYGTYDGTNAINAYAITGTQKASAGNSAYGSNKYIYIHNNGTQNLDSSKANGLDTGTYTLDEMHVIFYDINNTKIGPASTGYIPDKLSGYTEIYRMQVPSNAVYFQITNGEGKGTGSNYYSRQSEIKEITANGLYEFVSGKDNAADYITADSTVPTGDNATREAPKYLLTLSNEKKVELDDDVPETSTFDVKLAVVVTGEGGTQKYIKWLKQKNGEVDQAYLNHTNADVGETAGTGGNGIKVVSVVKNGTYYWKEVVAPAGYELNENTFEFIKTDSTTSTVTTTVTDKKISGKVILTKTAKEKVGTTNIGDPLAGAVFKVFKSDGTTVTGFTGTYTTDSEGKLTIEGLSPGDYYLEEQTAPAGFVATDSNNVVNGTAQNKRVYFSIGDNTTTKYLTCADEMAPAYIKLYEHINEWRPTEWGDPTFIFKITNTTSSKTSIVALTVDDNGTLDDNVLTSSVTSKTFTSWKVESTDEIDDGKREYQGMYHIDSQGRIRVEPGEYTITRIPVSRYEFVTAAKTDAYTGTTAGTQKENIDGSNQPLETVTITDLTAGKTIDVHYYDEVKYYDKFSHVDTKVNKFYKLDESKKNTTVKGISVSNILSNAVTISDSTGTVNVSAYKVFVDGTIDTTAISASELTIDFGDLNSEFSYNSTNGTITINNVQTYTKKVYTVTAKYDSNRFTTTFDIAIP